MKGRGWDPGRTALASNLSQLPLTNPTVPCFTKLYSQQDQSSGLPHGGISFSCFTRQGNRGMERLQACSSITQGANHSHRSSAFQHSSSETPCFVLIFQVWHYVKHSQCTSGGLSSSPLTHLLQHQKCAAVAWKSFRSVTALIRLQLGVSSICCKLLFAIDYHIILKICSGLHVTRQDAQRREHRDLLLLLNLSF